ncbi:inositol monophosphatase [Devosia pacifica]|uniref:Inositol monophosphatase n=1 Tax=Devosia pacifica TaxID=1335967 RepID=A0A918S5D7_9HYPH|nr:inositol monophosphatase [Devosia pacifica]GHA21455.1 inositol monophosphatase [Devosia pacifica]
MTTLSDTNIEKRYIFAMALAERAGAHALKLQQAVGAQGLSVENKGLQDFVTNADRECEDLIHRAINQEFASDRFIGEETGGEADGGPAWVIDPIDGTNNYMRGLPNWGVSIAFIADNAIACGAIFDASTGLVYHARSGGGAYAGKRQICASQCADPQTALAITGHSRRTPIAPYLALLSDLHELGFDHRRPGAAALGLLRVAEGKAELFHEAHLNSWDVMAGILIAREAGAVVEHPSLDALLDAGGPVLACAPALHPSIAHLFGPETTGEPMDNVSVQTAL